MTITTTNGRHLAHNARCAIRIHYTRAQYNPHRTYPKNQNRRAACEIVWGITAARAAAERIRAEGNTITHITNGIGNPVAL